MSADPNRQGLETALVRRIIRPQLAGMTPEAARAVLALTLDESDRLRAHELSVKAQGAGLTAEEEAELQVYRVVGRVIELMWSKARASLKKVDSKAAIIGDE